MLSVASAPGALPPPPPPAPTRHGRSLLHKMIQRYFALPPVEAWLMRRHRPLAGNAHALKTSLSYACMYYTPSVVPRGADRYPLPKPFLDTGDVLLCHHVFDGVAVGTLFNAEEDHALSIARDSLLRNQARPISRRPRTRNFAVDLRVKQLEVIEFAWMEDDSLVVACRRLVDADTAERRFVLSADMLFFEPIPPTCRLEKRFLILSMQLREKVVICEFCGAQGYQSCACPNSLKRKAPSRSSSPSDVVIPTRDRRSEPTGRLAGAIGSWENYTNAVFSCSQMGSFFITIKRRNRNGELVKMKDLGYPVRYQFICGQPHETLTLLRAYVSKMNLCARELTVDTYLYGGGLSRGMQIGMIVDKQDEKPQEKTEGLPHIFPSSECEDSFFKPHGMTYIANAPPMISDPLLSNSFTSQVTLPTDEYSPAVTTIEIPSIPAIITPQSSEDGSHLSIGPSQDSPISTYLGQDEHYPGTEYIDMDEARSESLRILPNEEYNPWNEPQITPPSIVINQPPPPPRPLSTTSRELQGFMTENAAGVPTCSECGSSFHKRGNLARHVQTVHLKLKPFQCDQCPAKFGYKTHLNRHKSVHQRGHDFRCGICNRDFRGQVKLTRHMQEAHQQPAVSDDNVKKIQCEVCGVSFSQKSNLSRHMQIHNGVRFLCPVCPDRLSFGQKYDLQRHIQRKHEGYSEALVLGPAPVPERRPTLEELH